MIFATYFLGHKFQCIENKIFKILCNCAMNKRREEEKPKHKT